MERALVAISILLAAAACAAQEPQADAPAATAIAAATDAPAAADPSAAEPSAAASGEAVPRDSLRTAENAGPASAVGTEAPAPPAGAEPPQSRERAPEVARAHPATPAPTVELNKLADDTVCRKERPTGSLIGVTRCYSRSAAANRSDNELMKRDVEEIRRRQNERLAREAGAMSRGRGGL